MTPKRATGLVLPKTATEPTKGSGGHKFIRAARDALNKNKAMFQKKTMAARPFKKGGAAMSDKAGRALGRKTADAKGRAMKKGK